MKKGYQVFISHSTSDKTIAFNICNYLENQAIKCWIAPRDMNYGDYANSLLHGIENSQIFLLILSKKANESPHVLREVNHALSHNLKIIPIRIEDIQPTNAMTYYLNTIHWFDVFNANKQIDIDKIVQIVQGVITETPIEVVEQLINPSKVTFKKSTIGLIITFFIIGFTSFYLYYKKNEYKSRYIKDVNLPDNKQVKPNESLHKKWVIQNIGLTDWNNLEMERVGTSEGDGLIKSTSSFQVPKTLTNEKVVLGVEIQMPSTSGSTIAYWKLKRKDNSFLNSFLLKTQNPIFTKLNVIDESGLSQDTNCPNGSIINVDTTFIKNGESLILQTKYGKMYL
ncbi:MAG: Unknown protein [uncultured Sulfurovum sp.]|uniref:TIR domain-containing protein n=1 Tax=uncultured Sulfurovum sp. TaxID=269237 RepID=A0A6S6TAH7_9BACT|nr:MAG: Unknown protein [uncultured Sulfurovum sp.]